MVPGQVQIPTGWLDRRVSAMSPPPLPRRMPFSDTTALQDRRGLEALVSEGGRVAIAVDAVRWFAGERSA